MIYTRGHSHMELRGLCGQESFSDRLNKEKRGSFSEDKIKIGGHLVRTKKKKKKMGVLQWSPAVKPSVFRKKKRVEVIYSEALNLSAKWRSSSEALQHLQPQTLQRPMGTAYCPIKCTQMAVSTPWVLSRGVSTHTHDVQNH